MEALAEKTVATVAGAEGGHAEVERQIAGWGSALDGLVRHCRRTAFAATPWPQGAESGSQEAQLRSMQECAIELSRALPWAPGLSDGTMRSFGCGPRPADGFGRIGSARVASVSTSLPGRAAASRIVWRQAVRAEMSRLSQILPAAVLIDLTKCYEHIEHNKLASEGVLLQFPLHFLRLTVGSYRLPRHVTHGGLTDNGVCAGRGTVPGCVAATIELTLLMMRMAVGVVARHPRANFEFYLADLTTEGD